jgi:hypothetical protein
MVYNYICKSLTTYKLINMAKFKIQSGISPSRRGRRAIYTEYEELYPLLPKMKEGDSIKIVEVPETKRNSAYLAINGVLQKQFSQLEGNYAVRSTKLEDDKVEIRVFREPGIKKKKR